MSTSADDDMSSASIIYRGRPCGLEEGETNPFNRSVNINQETKTSRLRNTRVGVVVGLTAINCGKLKIHRERYVGDRPMRADGNRDMSDRRSSTYREQGHHRIQTTNFSSFTTRLRSTKWTPDAKANGVRFVFQSSMSRISKTCGTSVDQLMPVLHFTLHP
uniref:ZP domain-containing protein n=1 Tax=Panagrellus redivivus TaxID=6233 RepID=A0A7E4W1B7_PANRE